MPGRWCMVVVALGLTACARSPVLPAALEACPRPDSGTSLLTVEGDDGGSRQLVLHSSRESAGLTLVALDTIGAPQFTARLEGDRLEVERRPVYRGPDPHWLVWGWQWWQLRDELHEDCVAASGYVTKVEGNSRELWRRGQLYWRWSAQQPDRFLLPRQGSGKSSTEGLAVSVRAMESSDQ